MPEKIDKSQLPHLSAFELIKHLDKDGRECWSARGVNPYHQTIMNVNIVHPDSKPFQIRLEAYIPGWNGVASCCTHRR